MCCQDSTSKPLVIPLYTGDSAVFCIQLFASRGSSHCKHDVGALSWLNAETVERAITHLFGKLVRCSAHGRSFKRLWYKLNIRSSVQCWNRDVQFLIMYTVNNTNFFDFGVDAGDTQLMVDGISIRFLQLLRPIQLFERFQRTLFVSQLCILSPICKTHL